MSNTIIPRAASVAGATAAGDQFLSAGEIVDKKVDDYRRDVNRVFSALDGLSNQQIMNTLMLSLVVHIEITILKKYRAATAAGIGQALLANFADHMADLPQSDPGDEDAPASLR